MARIFVISAGIRGGVIAGMAYRVWGCPPPDRGPECVCTRFEGQPVAGLENFDSADITQELSVPVEKTGCILLLEDALAKLWAQCAGTEDQG